VVHDRGVGGKSGSRRVIVGTLALFGVHVVTGRAARPKAFP
jgi:hypothetical protein